MYAQGTVYTIHVWAHMCTLFHYKYISHELKDSKYKATY